MKQLSLVNMAAYCEDSGVNCDACVSSARDGVVRARLIDCFVESGCELAVN